MSRGLVAAALLCVSAASAGCPLCLGAFQQTKAQQLVGAQRVVLAATTADPSRFRVIEVIKGGRPSSGTIEGGYPRSAPPADAAGPKSGNPLLLARDDLFPTWVILGTIGAEHSGWLRKLAAGKRSAEMTADDWQARAALMLPYLEHHEPLVAEIAFGELAAVPYGALLTLKPRIDVRSIRRGLADPALAPRQSLYLLMLGIAGNVHDAEALEQRLEVMQAAAGTSNLGSMIAADLQLRGPARLAWVEERYLVDRGRSTAEIEAALLALSVHGNANAAIPRERVIVAYRKFMSAHPDVAGYVAQDLATWQYWDAVPDYVALLRSGTKQQYPSRLAIIAYLRQSPNASAIEIP